MATARDLLAMKDSEVCTITQDRMVLEATQLMNDRQIGSIVVLETADSGTPAGIFTERDVLRRVVADRRDAAATPVHEVMTSELVSCTPETTLDELRQTCMRRRVRHLPVIEDGRLVGMLSLGDINAWELRDGEVTIRYMQQYIQGRM